ncbi:chemotaxis response regulator protein-glutamate methylesterase [Soehngenia longivitae]|uniref:Protein-glutamate methylesterase/protein-glutamine glutaminase n=1 Tax=Soehngenia longivitae TaxID=2562294 RepID=A0A4Z0D4Q0_9FIRM|nr:chemotaxis response regulator protein-glutamate methylesterase [Soehngenia longivitae]
MRLLIVDDSAFMRRIISDMLKDVKEITIVGTARNGKEALEMIPKLNPDVVSLDVEMPIMNGIKTLEIIREKYKIPVIMLSSNTNSEITIEALEKGAFDFIEKPTNINENIEELKNDLASKIIASVLKRKGKEDFKTQQVKKKVIKNNDLQIKAIAIGASTGGPKALVSLIKELPSELGVPIFIVQHMPAGFTTSLASRMDIESKLKVVEASDEMVIEKNVVYLAPGDYHMTVGNKKIRLDKREKINGVRPSVDYLFESAAEVYTNNLLGVILTGMGKDGSTGMKRIKEFNGYTIAQDKESSTIFGMPQSAIKLGVVDEILSLNEISQRIIELLR